MILKHGYLLRINIEKYLVAVIVEIFKLDVHQYEQKITIKKIYFCIL